MALVILGIKSYFLKKQFELAFLSIGSHIVFLYPDKQGIPGEDRRIQRLKRYVTTNNNKNKDSNPKKKNTQNIAHQASSQK